MLLLLINFANEELKHRGAMGIITSVIKLRHARPEMGSTALNWVPQPST